MKKLSPFSFCLSSRDFPDSSLSPSSPPPLSDEDDHENNLNDDRYDHDNGRDDHDYDRNDHDNEHDDDDGRGQNPS